MMRTGKRAIAAVTLALATTLALAACSSSTGPSTAPSQTGTESAAPAEPATLTITTWRRDEPGIKDWWVEYAAAFEKEHPNVTVEVENIAFADYVSAWTARGAGGSGRTSVDTPLPAPTVPAWAAGGLLRPVDDRIAGTDIEKLWPESQSVFQWDGSTYGVLLVNYPFLLFYNEEILADAGIEVPTTAEELTAAIDKLTTGDQFGYTVTADNSVNFIREALKFQTGLGAKWAEPGTWRWTDPAVAAVDVWRNAAKHAPRGVDVNASRQAFLDGNVAMMIEGPYFIAAAQKASSPKAEGKLHVAPVPFETTPGDVSLGFALPAEGNEANEDLAWAFIDGAASEQWQSRYAELTSSTVARPGASDVLASNPDAAVGAKAQAEAVPVVPMNLQGLRTRYADFVSIAAPVFHQLIDTDVDTATALADLTAQLEAEKLLP